MDGLKARARVLSDEERAASSGRRPMWRRVVDQSTGEIKAVLDPPNFPRQEETHILDPNREYNVILWGVTDVFEETKDFGNGPVTTSKYIFEFKVVNSAKWNDVVVMGYYPIPKDWGNPKAQLAELAFALEGHRLADDEDFDIGKHLLAPTKFKVWITTELSKQKKKPYNNIERHYPMPSEVNDDFVPDTAPVAAPPVTQGASVAQQAAPTYADDGVPDDFVPDDIDVDAIPF